MAAVIPTLSLLVFASSSNHYILRLLLLLQRIRVVSLSVAGWLHHTPSHKLAAMASHRERDALLHWLCWHDGRCNTYVVQSIEQGVAKSYKNKNPRSFVL